jgi:hypothetical protein
MQVLASPADREASAQITAKKQLLDRWEEAAARVGQELLADRHMFDFCCSHE